MNTRPHLSVPLPAALLSGLFIASLGISAGLAIGCWHPSADSDGAQHRARFERALITSVQGSRFRALPPSGGADPLLAIRTRYAELDLGPSLVHTFKNRDDGYVLLMWLGELPAGSRKEFLWGLGIVVDETVRRHGDIARAINQYHDAYHAEPNA